MEIDDERIKKMIEQGYMRVAGKNSVGDEYYQFTEKFYREQPNLVSMIKKAESDVMFSLWLKGFLEIKMDSKGYTFVYLTDKSSTWADSEELSHTEKVLMYTIYSTEGYNDPRYDN